MMESALPWIIFVVGMSVGWTIAIVGMAEGRKD
jgi:hypothetical protein